MSKEFPGRKGRAIMLRVIIIAKLILLAIARCYDNSARDMHRSSVRARHCLIILNVAQYNDSLALEELL